jgi:hypothetical protein
MGISSGTTQTDAQRPFSSVVIGNASGATFSGATQSDRAVRGDANLPQICASDASQRTSGNVRSRLADVSSGPLGSDPASMRLLKRASDCAVVSLRRFGTLRHVI